MAEDGRVVTTKLPADLLARLDEVALQIDRSKSWIVRQAVGEWLSEHERRHALTLEALKSVDEGRTISHDDVIKRMQERKARRMQGS